MHECCARVRDCNAAEQGEEHQLIAEGRHIAQLKLRHQLCEA